MRELFLRHIIYSPTSLPATPLLSFPPPFLPQRFPEGPEYNKHKTKGSAVAEVCPGPGLERVSFTFLPVTMEVSSLGHTQAKHSLALLSESLHLAV